MKAAVLFAPDKPITIEDVEIDRPQDHEVLVRTVACGVCHSDLHFREGSYPCPLPTILGHEVAGIVEEVGDRVTYVQPQDRVVACLSVFCGVCAQCLTGHPNRCQQTPQRGDTDLPKLTLTRDRTPINQFSHISGFAEKVLVHENALLKLPQNVPFDVASLMGCGVLTGLGAVFNSARVEAGSKVVVFGMGGVGLAAVQGSVIAGALQIIAVDLNDANLTRAREFGATDTVNASLDDPVKIIKQITGGGVDYSFEAVGLQKTAGQAFRSLAYGGTATMIGLVPLGEKLEIEVAHMLQSERKIQGSFMGSNRFRVDMPRYFEFYRQGRLNLDAMITRRGRLGDVNDAFKTMKLGEGARTVLMFD
jgi:S-(hydroxymethyl)glutathione dehydrogenase/alcohol dehydrogenase